MGPLRTLVHIIDFINERVGHAMAWLTILMVINVFLVVVLRYVFSVGYIWMQESYIWMHATVFLLGAGYTLMHEGHVRIDLFYGSAGPRYRAWINILGSVFFALPMFWFFLDKSWPMIMRSWDNLEQSPEAGGLPGLFLFKSVIAVFCVLFTLQIIALLLRNIEALLGIDDKPEFQDGDDKDALL